MSKDDNQKKCEECGNLIEGIRFHRDQKQQEIICYSCAIKKPGKAPAISDYVEPDAIRKAYDKLLIEDELLSGVLYEHKVVESSFYLYKSGYKAGVSVLEEKLKIAIETLETLEPYLKRAVRNDLNKILSKIKMMECCGNCEDDKNCHCGNCSVQYPHLKKSYWKQKGES